MEQTRGPSFEHRPPEKSSDASRTLKCTKAFCTGRGSVMQKRSAEATAVVATELEHPAERFTLATDDSKETRDSFAGRRPCLWRTFMEEVTTDSNRTLSSGFRPDCGPLLGDFLQTTGIQMHQQVFRCLPIHAMPLIAGRRPCMVQWVGQNEKSETAKLIECRRNDNIFVRKLPREKRRISSRD